MMVSLGEKKLRSYQTPKSNEVRFLLDDPALLMSLSAMTLKPVERDEKKKCDHSFSSHHSPYQTLHNISDNTAFHTLVNIAVLVLMVLCGQRQAEPFMNACVLKSSQ